MYLRHLLIQNFRGIRTLEWTVRGSFACLIGPGDSTKSTILDAVELVLSNRWNVVLDESDFYNGEENNKLFIEATLGPLPDDWLRDTKFGMHTRGWHAGSGKIRDEPDLSAGDEIAITIRFDWLDSEPKWRVVTERTPDGVSISAKDRESIAAGRLGAHVDRHLTWSRGTALARLTTDPESIAGILASAAREARRMIEPTGLRRMAEVATQVHSLAGKVGVSPQSAYEPRLDPGALSLSPGSLALHQGEVPLRRLGLGSRRLLGLAIQREVTKAGGITLVDELEHGLEPHRIRGLLGELRPKSRGCDSEEAGPGPTDTAWNGQVLLTTHSPVVVAELSAAELYVVRRTADHQTLVTPVPAELQRIVRKVPEALLARRIIVCEGRTELGLCIHMAEHWKRELVSLPYRGVALADGGGEELRSIAMALATLRYDVAVFADSDKSPDDAGLIGAGVKVVRWSGTSALEQRVFLDLPWAGVLEAVALARELADSEAAIIDSAASALQTVLASGAYANDEVQARVGALKKNAAEWAESLDLRKALGLAAKGTKSSKAWFKDIARGRKLGEVVGRHLAEVAESDLTQKLNALKQWILDDGHARSGSPG